MLAAGDVTYFTDTMKTAMTNGFSQVATDVSSVVATALPIGLGIMGLFLGIRLAIGFFRSVAH